MFSDHKTTNRTLAFFTFIAALILYMSTMSPTASFWDPGEFIAVAHGLEVTHPPGAPIFELLGRLFSMFMPRNWVAYSVNMISVLSSALTVMLLFMIIVRLVREWKGDPKNMLPIDKIGMFGGALIGAFAFAVTDSFWFNAVEAEVYALSMFFTAMVVWLALVWSAHHKDKYSERWLILIAYMFGLALGVHLLNLLALFFVALIIYFREREFELLSFCVTAVLAVLSFLLIYPFTVQTIPEMMKDITKASYGLIGPVVFIIFVAIILGIGLYYTQKHGNRLTNILLISYTMILVGYSSYALIFIRSAANPPIDENDPETLERFISYLKREQYGQTPLLSGHTYDNQTGNINRDKTSLFPRRYSTSPRHIQQYRKYSSDWDFFVHYQLQHMYIRYFNWNFIGRDSDIQDDGWQAGFSKSAHQDNPAHNSYFYIPFLLGLFGMLFHFQNDWKRALSVLALFIMTGFAIIVFLNQTPMQPRERDYAYVGSFFAFAIWIGMGGVGLVELVKDYLDSNKLAAYGLLGVLFVCCPLWMGLQNYNDHDRSDRYVAPDYAYNLLQSTAPNAILFTNGDNDTFPLWYLQEVEGVRTDVRIVCLSLLNTDWYIKQLKHQWSHESPPLPISLSDDQIDQLTQNLSLHQPDTVNIPVNKSMLGKAFSGPKAYKKAIGVPPDTSLAIFSKQLPFQIAVDSLDTKVSWYLKGRSAGKDRQGNPRYYLQAQDKMILNILKTNHWLRPVYFANTVSSQSQLKLHPYFRLEGLASRIIPQRHSTGRLGWINTGICAKRFHKFRFRDWNKPGNYLDQNIRRMMGNYQISISELADKYKQMGKPDSANYWLKWGQKNLPFTITTNNVNSIVLYALKYAQVGNTQNAVELAQRAQKKMIPNLKNTMSRYNDIQKQISQLTQKFKKARQNADMDEQRSLKNKAQNIASGRRNIANQVSSSIGQLTIVQRIYYLAGNDKMAKDLANRVNQITTSQISLPESKEANKKQMQKMGFAE